jgi:hypothetical protein
VKLYLGVRGYASTPCLQPLAGKSEFVVYVVILIQVGGQFLTSLINHLGKTRYTHPKLLKVKGVRFLRPLAASKGHVTMIGYRTGESLKNVVVVGSVRMLIANEGMAIDLAHCEVVLFI